MMPPFDLPEFSLKLPDVLGGHISFPYKSVYQAVELFHFEFVQPDILVYLNPVLKTAHDSPTRQRRRVS